jgi:hypothetical protein
MRHLRRDWHEAIQDPDQKTHILPDEPVLIIPASDPDAPMMARVYAAYKHRRGTEAPVVRAYQWWADQMQEYARDHFADEHMRGVSDIDESVLDAPHEVLHPVIGQGEPREVLGAEAPVPMLREIDDEDVRAMLLAAYGPREPMQHPAVVEQSAPKAPAEEQPVETT